MSGPRRKTGARVAVLPSPSVRIRGDRIVPLAHRCICVRSELLRVLRRRLAPDLGDLAVAVAHQPLYIAPQILVQQLDLLTGRGLAERGLVENLPLGALRPVDLAGPAMAAFWASVSGRSPTL